MTKTRTRRRRPSKQRVRPTNKWGIRERDLHAPGWETHDEQGNLVWRCDSVPAALAKAGEKAEEVWLWCLHCCRFFQAKHLKRDFLGDWQQCPFEDCGAAGFDVDILIWDCERELDPCWPRSTDELFFGQRYPPLCSKEDERLLN